MQLPSGRVAANTRPGRGTSPGRGRIRRPGRRRRNREESAEWGHHGRNVEGSAAWLLNMRKGMDRRTQVTIQQARDALLQKPLPTSGSGKAGRTTEYSKDRRELSTPRQLRVHRLKSPATRPGGGGGGQRPRRLLALYETMRTNEDVCTFHQLRVHRLQCKNPRATRPDGAPPRGEEPRRGRSPCEG